MAAEAEAAMAEAVMTAKPMPAKAETTIFVPAVEAKLAVLEVAMPEAAVVAILGRLDCIGICTECRQLARHKRCCMTGHCRR